MTVQGLRLAESETKGLHIKGFRYYSFSKEGTTRRVETEGGAHRPIG